MKITGKAENEIVEYNDLDAAYFIQEKLEKEFDMELDIDTILLMLSLEFEYMESIGLVQRIEEE